MLVEIGKAVQAVQEATTHDRILEEMRLPQRHWALSDNLKLFSKFGIPMPSSKNKMTAKGAKNAKERDREFSHRIFAHFASFVVTPPV